MSVSWFGYAVIGCEVTGKIKLEAEVRDCKHAVAETAKFCEECGKPRLKKERIELEETVQVRELKRVGMAIVETTDGKQLFAGLVSRSLGMDNDPKRLNLEFEIVRDSVQTALTPLGLWDEASFGLYCVMRCSY